MQHAPHRPYGFRRLGGVLFSAAGLCACLLSALLAAPAPALADSDHEDDHERAKALLEAGEILPLEEVLRMAVKAHPGQPLEVRLTREEEHPGYIYAIQMLDADGEVWELELDAQTGELVDAQRDE